MLDLTGDCDMVWRMKHTQGDTNIYVVIISTVRAKKQLSLILIAFALVSIDINDLVHLKQNLTIFLRIKIIDLPSVVVPPKIQFPE